MNEPWNEPAEGEWSIRVEVVDDGTMRELPLRRFVAWIARLLSPGYSHCGCCGMPWSIADGHDTEYRRGQGCFPLCNWCWPRMGRERRLPYYRRHWEESHRDDDVCWEEIERAVMAEDGRRIV